MVDSNVFDITGLPNCEDPDCSYYTGDAVQVLMMESGLI
jgi:hypothetical protein